MKETKEIWQLNATSDWILNWGGGTKIKDKIGTIRKSGQRLCIRQEGFSNGRFPEGYQCTLVIERIPCSEDKLVE